MAARCTREKGQDLLVDATLSLIDRYEFEVHLWGMGGDTGADAFKRELTERVASGGRAARSRFVFEGFRTDIETFYRTMDVVVGPSRFREPSGRTATEAMAWGRPAIVAGHGGLLEIVDHGGTSLVFEPHDADDLATQIKILLRDEGLRRRLGRQGREEVERRFLPGPHADAVLHVHRDLIERGR